MRTTWTNGLVALLFAASAGCRAHDPYSRVQSLAEAGQCEDALEELARRQGKPIGTLARAQQAGGTVSSYAVTGIGYTSDIVISVTGGVAIGVLVCSPILLLEVALDSKGGKESGRCIGEIGVEAGKAINPELGKHAYSSTASWRQDLDYTPMSRALRKVAVCHAGRGDNGSLVKGYVQLQQIVDAGLYERSSEGERMAVDAEFERIELKLAAVDPEEVRRAQAKYEALRGQLASESQPRIWREGQAGAVWRFVAVSLQNGEQAREVCANTSSETGAWRLPTIDEAKRAIAAGLLDPKRNPGFGPAVDRGERAWVDDRGSLHALQLDTGLVTEAVESGREAQLLCVR